jgi:predicted phosphodiesterase
MRWQRIGFFTDEHRPYQERKAVDLSLQILRDFRPDELIIGSDGLDFRPLHKGNERDPTIVGTLERVERPSFFQGIEEKREACPDAEFIYIGGNHEYRWYPYVTRLGELAFTDELRLWKWLKLDELAIRYYLHTKLDGIEGIEPMITISSRYQVSPKLVIMHGKYIRKWSGRAAQAQLKDGLRGQSSVVMGHTHKLGMFVQSDDTGKPIAGWEAGCHQRFDMPWLKEKNPDWQWGLTLVESEPEMPWRFSVEQILYIPYAGMLTARWRGKEYTSA